MTPAGGLAGARVLVVGASSGIGRAVGLAAAAGGARVALAARRSELLDTAVARAGDHSVAIPCDVRVPGDCERVVEEAASALGGLDAVVYGAGISPLSRLVDAGPGLWQSVVETNLIGAALVAAAALPHLLAGGGRLVLLGSSSEGRPFPGLVPYACTKAALHELARGLRNEHPELRVSTVVVGPTMSDLAAGWDPGLAGEMFSRWAAGGYLPTTAALPVEATAAQIVQVLASPYRIDELHVMPDPDPAP